jgi:uncharacterized repeat protein (TIGR01451 family)
MMSSLRRLIALSLMVSLWFFAGSAQALTPANALLKNTAKLVYDGNTTGIFASVEVKVRLIKTNVTLLIEPSSTLNLAEGQGYQDTYKVVATNNGEDTYTLNNIVVLTSVSSPSPFTYVVDPLTLGASALTDAAVASTSLLVPYDGVGATDTINGLEKDDIIRVGASATEYTIVSVTHDAGANKTTILVNNTVTAGAGEGLFEVKSFTMNATSVGTLPALPSAIETGTLVVTTSIKNSEATSTPVTSAVTITVVRIKMSKYVACNVSTAPLAALCDETGVTGTPFNYDKANNTETVGDIYYLGGVQAQPGAILEYLIVVENTSPATINDAVLTDVLAGFTTYQADTTLLNGVTVVPAGEAVGAFLLGNAGLSLQDGARAAATQGTGDIAAGTKAYVVYQVILD